MKVFKIVRYCKDGILENFEKDDGVYIYVGYS